MKSVFVTILLLCLTAWTKFCNGLYAPEKTTYSDRGNGWGWVPQVNSTVFETFGACLDSSKITLATNGDPVFLGLPRMYYYSGGSGFGLSLYAEAFLGLKPESVNDMARMCPAVFISSPQVRYVSGYGKMFKATCVQEDSGKTTKCTRDLTPGSYDPGVDITRGIKNKKYYLVETDNKYYLIFLTCVDDKYVDFQLVTTRPYVAPNEAAAFVKHIKAANLPLDKALLLACRIPKGYTHHYPYPFNNYPNSPSDYYSHGHSHSGNGWSHS